MRILCLFVLMSMGVSSGAAGISRIAPSVQGFAKEAEKDMPLNHDVVWRSTPVTERGKFWRYTVNINSNCTGVFIFRNVLVTAKHCFKEKQDYINVYWFTGSHRNDVVSAHGSGFTIYRHSEYDVAVVIFEKGLEWPEGEGHAPVETMANTSMPDTQYFAVGTGIFNRSVESGDYLGFTSGTFSTSWWVWDSYKFNLADGSGICSGDSGGPVFVHNQGGSYLLAGILIRASSDILCVGSECKSHCGTHVDFVPMTLVRDWIFEVTKGHGTEPPSN